MSRIEVLNPSLPALEAKARRSLVVLRLKERAKWSIFIASVCFQEKNKREKRGRYDTKQGSCSINQHPRLANHTRGYFQEGSNDLKKLGKAVVTLSKEVGRGGESDPPPFHAYTG